MSNISASLIGIVRRMPHIGVAVAAAAAFGVMASQPARAERVTPPAVPANLQVPAGNSAFLVGHAVGTQNYVCLPAASGFAWTLFTPEATLFKDDAKQLITHFFSPNPFENGTVRATWQSSQDTSSVWAQVVPNGASTDPSFVAPGAVAWLLLQAVGTQKGPDGGDTLFVTTFVQRLNTVGGSAPATGCAQLADVGRKAFVPYTADYFFYTKDAS
jgi:hypothetical protein